MARGVLACAFLYIYIGHHYVKSASVAIKSSVGVLGNYPHSVQCNYNLTDSEGFSNFQLYQAGSQSPLATLSPAFSNPSLPNPSWSPGIPEDFKQRATLMRSSGSNFILMVFNNTVCNDEQGYRCLLNFNTQTGGQFQWTETTQVSVEASPGAPTMTASPGYNITENTTVIFTCTGNVGKPPGQFEWYMYRGSTWENKTDKAAPQSNSLATPSCTYTGRSSINITMTRMEQEIVMRCRVYHPTQGSNTSIEDCTDVSFCRSGDKVFVFYPVSISISPQSPVISVEQGTDYTLTCSAEGFPFPKLKWFKKSDPNNTLETSSTLKLKNLSVNDSDDYVCFGSNNINGAELNDSRQVRITVVPTTTPPPTTTSTKTTTNNRATTTASGGVANQVQDSGMDKTAIIVGVIVPVVVIIIIVIIMVCICRRRAVKKPPVEEPPEKPFNNHSRINTIASRPDLVSSEKTYPAFDNSKAFVNEDGLTYAQLQLDNKPRSRRPLALDDSHTDYSDISMPQV